MTEKAGTRIVIVVPEDAAEATVASIQAQLPEIATVISAGDGPTLQQSIDGLVRAAADLPERVEAWWTSMQSAGPGPLAALAIVLALFAAVYVAERLIVEVVARRRRAVHPLGPTYPARIAAALGWGLAQAGRLLFFYVGCRVLIAAAAGADTPMHVLGLLALAAILRFRILTAAVELLAAAGARRDGRPG